MCLNKRSSLSTAQVLWTGSSGRRSTRKPLFSRVFRVCFRRSGARARRGLSLLEVVLALTILGISAAFLTQAMQLATQNALKSQNLSQAEVVAESVVSQVVAGVLPLQAITWAPYGVSTSTSTWQYTIIPVTAEVQGMMGFQVAVRDSSRITGSEQPDLVITRWIIDPSLAMDVPPSSDTTSGTSTSSTSSSGGQAASSSTGQTSSTGR